MTAARRKLVTGALAVLAVLMSTTACGDSPAGANEILVYNAEHEQLAREWVDAFTRETGIRVTLRNGGDTDLADQVVAEAEKSPADVLLTANSTALAPVVHAGLFADIDPATRAQVPEQYGPSTGTWIGIAARSTAFVYNRDELPADRLPASLLDLQQPQWQGRWTVDPSGADFQATVAGLLALRGEDVTRAWLRGMKANAASAPDSIASLRVVDSGRIAGGLIEHDYWYRDQAGPGVNSGNTALHYFRNQDPGAFVSISGAGVLKSSKRSEAAQSFVRFLTGRTAQQIVRDGMSMEYPIAAGVPAHPALPPLDTLQPPRVDPARLDAEKATQLITEAGLL
ncbi:extracellular solute-binding protein [Nocardia sp. BMG51109]|uniref:extracellular solute-binding protein n=1 Tax=Nocardia sp. BMG51109 TaxID=1056816 RepID=UPI0004639133|nr:extracellular solute-binding protein [Nocardia sp. BMG51109]